MKTLKELGLRVPEILLPADTPLNKWSVIACDQYTQDKEYWKKAEAAAGNGPSTLNLILPEVYLNSPDKLYLHRKKNRLWPNPPRSCCPD